jgi:hypothetical protein
MPRSNRLCTALQTPITVRPLWSDLTMVPVDCSMMDDMVCHHGLAPAPLHSGVLLTAYTPQAEKALNQQMPKCHSILVWLTTPKISVCKMLQKTLDLI